MRAKDGSAKRTIQNQNCIEDRYALFTVTRARALLNSDFNRSLVRATFRLSAIRERIALIGRGKDLEVTSRITSS